MGGAFTGFILLGIGTLYGALLTGAFRASDRAARNGRYIRMPGNHRNTRPLTPLRNQPRAAWKVTAGLPDDDTPTMLPGQMEAAR